MKQLARTLAALLVLSIGVAWMYRIANAQESLRIYPDANKGYATYIRNAPAYIDARVLAANVSETHTKPAAANAVIFSSSCAAFYAKIGASAAVPAADVTNGSASELNPSSWFMGAATQVTLIAPTDCIITLSWYNLTL